MKNMQTNLIKKKLGAWKIFDLIVKANNHL